jgi:hypothetical protein
MKEKRRGGGISLNKVLYSIIFTLAATIVVFLALDKYRSTKERSVPEVIEGELSPELLGTEDTLMRRYLSKREVVETWNGLIMVINYTCRIIEKANRDVVPLVKRMTKPESAIAQFTGEFKEYFGTGKDVEFLRGFLKQALVALFNFPDPIKIGTASPGAPEEGKGTSGG